MTTIKDVAKYAGTSVATVSRVLSDKPNVRAETREHVLNAIDALDYRPNRIASSLRSQKSNVIGLLVSDIRNPFFTAIARAIEDIAHENNMSVFFCNTDESQDKEAQYLNTLVDEHVAGIILSSTTSKSNLFQNVLEQKIPLVLIDRRIDDLSVDSVMSDNVHSAELLTDHLAAQGFENIGAILALKNSSTGRERMQGFHESVRKHNIESRRIYCKPNEQDGAVIVRDWLTSENPPDAILTGNSRLTIGALDALEQIGLQVPKDVALAGFDETIWTPHVGNGITVVSQPTYEMGKTAAELLLSRIESPERPIREVVLKGSLIVRGSTNNSSQT